MRSQRRTAQIATLVAIMLTLAACGTGNRADTASPTTDPAPRSVPDGGWIGEDDDLDWAAGLDEESAVVFAAGGETAESGASRADGDDRVAADTVAPAPGLPSEVEPPVGPADPPIVPPPTPPEVLDTSLSAGSVDDNAAWEDYLLYRQELLARGLSVHDVDVSGRQMLRVGRPDGTPVLGATVEIISGDGTVVATLTSHADGRVMFFAPPAPDGGQQDPTPGLTATVTLDAATVTVELSRESLVHDVVLDAAPTPAPVPLDVLFLIDATGSMSDEIEQLKANMVSVAEQIDAVEPRPDVRFAMTVYRDHGDLFVTRTFDFTPDVTDFTAALRDVVADGGGDYAEALDQGLHDALAEPSWRGGDAVQLVFVIADAPPHLGDGFESTSVDYAAEALSAATRGVKIHPIASSGLDDQGEFVLRQLAQLTLGRFNFLTYGADGASPGESTPHHVDDYSVLSLDELVVELIADELAAL